MSNRMPLAIGAVLVGGAGYYLYASGGDAKKAEKRFQRDLETARARAATSGQHARGDAAKYGKEAGAQIDGAVARAQEEYNRAASNARETTAAAAKQAEAYGKDVQARVNKSVDEFDRKVEDAASKTTSGISGWFGGK